MAENKFGEEVLNVAGTYTPADKEFSEKNKQNLSAVAKDANDLIEQQKEYDYKALEENIKKQQDAIKKIDDHLRENLPKGVIRAYKEGAFGEKGSKEAKATMGNAIMGILADTLGNLGNAAGSVIGRSPSYQGGSNWYGEMQKGNLKQGLENKWEKDKASTESAINMAIKTGMAITDIQETISAFTSNAALQSQFNRMNESDKNYVIQVNKEAGQILSQFSTPEMLSYIQGMAAHGVDPKQAAAIAIAKFTPDLIKTAFPDGVPEGVSIEGLQNFFGNENGNNNNTKKETTLTFSDGSTITVPKAAGKKDFSALKKKATEIEQNWFNNGDEEQFMSDYKVLYNEWQNHPHANKEKGWFAAGTFKEPNEMLKIMQERRTGYLKALEARANAKNNIDNATNAKDKRTAQKNYDAAQKEINMYLGK